MNMRFTRYKYKLYSKEGKYFFEKSVFIYKKIYIELFLKIYTYLKFISDLNISHIT